MASTDVISRRHTTGQRLQSFFLAPLGRGGRRRSGSDVLKVILAIVAFAILWLGLSGRTSLQVEIANWLYPPPVGLTWLVRLIWAVVSAGAVLSVLAAALFGRRREILRDLLSAGVLAWLVCVIIQHFFGLTARFPHDAQVRVHGVNLGFPVPDLAVSVAVLLAALPYLSRGMQRTAEVLIGVGYLSALMVGMGLPIALLGSIVVGWACAALTRLSFGSPSGVPDSATIAGLLGDFGIEATEVHPTAHQQWGLARFMAQQGDGDSLRISVYGRDARDAQLFSKIYRTIWLRNDVGPFMITRAQQVDHECYLSLLADHAAQDAAPTVIASGIAGDSKTALVVSRIGAGSSLTHLVDEEHTPSRAALEQMAWIVAALGDAKLTHGSLDPDRFFINGDEVSLVDFDRARTHSPEEGIARDRAALLVILALASDAETAAGVGLAALGTDAFEAAMAYLQDAALPPSLVATLRRSKAKATLKVLRAACATAAGIEEPKLVEVKRVSWTNLILGVGTLIGGWALIGVFLHVAQAFSTIRTANWAWVTTTAFISPVAYVGSAAASLGSVNATIPYFPLVILELSNTFSGLALGTPAVMAARIRFFQKHGVDTTISVSSGVIVSTASWIVKGGLFLVSVPFAIGTLKFSQVSHDNSGSAGSGAGSSMLVWIVFIVVATGLAVTVALVVPRLRKMVAAKLLPRVREAFDHLLTLAATPRKLVEIFGGMLLAQLVTAIALGTALHSVGQHLNLPVILVVITLGSVIGGLSPVPGGMGVVEAGMILGLKAAGIPDNDAVAAVFIQRLFTAYLPPLAGWFALVWLRRKEYL